MVSKSFICRFNYANYQSFSYIPFEDLRESEKEKIRNKSEKAAKDFIKLNLKELKSKYPGCWLDCEHDLIGCAVYAYRDR